MKTCSFCGKSESPLGGLVRSRQAKSAAICETCIKICRDILDGKYETPAKKVVYRASTSASTRNAPRICSFCGRAQKLAGKLISSPRDREACFICDHCVASAS